MSARPSSPVARQPTNSARLGLIGAMLVYTGLVLLSLVAQPLFITGDESAHVDYAFDVTHGSIPVLGSSRTQEFPELGQDGQHQYLSNHPPAYHALVGPLVRAGAASEHPRAFLMLARVLTAVLGGAILLTLAATAGTVFRNRPRERAVAMITTASLAGSLAVLVGSASTIHNDALAVLMVCTTVLVLARAARAGQRPGTVALVAGFCTVGMLTRISFLPVWLLAIGAVTALELWPRLRRGRPGIGEIRHAALAALAVLVVPLLGAGWFYALSVRRYGDPTGGSAVYSGSVVARREYLPGAEHGPLAYMLTPSSWWAQVKQLGGAGASLSPAHPIHAALGAAVLGILLLAVVAGFLRGTGRSGLLDGPARWTIVALALVAVATFAELAWHASHKGSDSQRYMLDAIGFWAIASATVVASAPRRLAPYVVTVVAALLSIGSVLRTVEAREFAGHFQQVVSAVDPRSEPADGGWYATLVQGTELAGFPAAHIVVTLLLLAVAVGLAVQLVALRRLNATPAPAHRGSTPLQPSDPMGAGAASVGTRTPSVEQRGHR
jgi:hypothetical protein